MPGFATAEDYRILASIFESAVRLPKGLHVSVNPWRAWYGLASSRRSAICSWDQQEPKPSKRCSSKIIKTFVGEAMVFKGHPQT